MYAIVRLAKLGKSDLAGAESHNMRRYQSPTENIDASKTHLNRVVVGTSDLKADVENRIDSASIKRAIRHDAVHAIELVLTASPDFFDDADRRGDSKKMQRWIDDNVEFLKQRYSSENVVSVVVHYDETTPHIHALVTPIVANEDNENCLTAKPWTTKKALKDLQTDYANCMGKYGLKRGIEGSKAEHVSLKADRKNVLQYAKEARSLAAESKEIALLSQLKIEVELDKRALMLLKQERALHDMNKVNDLSLKFIEVQEQNAALMKSQIEQQQQFIELQKATINDLLAKLAGTSETSVGPQQRQGGIQVREQSGRAQHVSRGNDLELGL